MKIIDENIKNILYNNSGKQKEGGEENESSYWFRKSR